MDEGVVVEEGEEARRGKKKFRKKQRPTEER
jgi:hypothetical protein